MRKDSNRLIILHTNDLHSSFENMPKLASMIGRYRSAYDPDELLVIDCGDHLDRVRQETEGTTGLANVEVMNATGYDVFVPGNNEGLTFPKSVFESVFRERAKFAVLGTNMFDLQTGLVPPWMESTLIVDKGGLRIGMIGLTVSFNDFYHPLGWDVREPLHMAALSVARLRKRVDFLLVISHAGIQFDRRLAEEVAGIDCIIGGHTHHLFEQAERVGDTLIGAAGKFGTHLGIIEAEFESDSHRLVHLNGFAEQSAGEPDDQRISALIEIFRGAGRAVMERQVAVLDASISHDPRVESELGNLLADGIRKWTDSEVGIVNSGQLLNGLAAGKLTEADLLAVCPSPINPCSVRLYGSELRQALEESLLDEFVEKTIRGFGFRGEMLGTLCLSGMEVLYDRASPPYDKIKSIFIGNEPIDPERLYKVGTIDMFTFGIGYQTLAQGRETHYYLPEFIRDVLKRELADPLAIANCKRILWRPIGR